MKDEGRRLAPPADDHRALNDERNIADVQAHFNRSRAVGVVTDKWSGRVMRDIPPLRSRADPPAAALDPPDPMSGAAYWRKEAREARRAADTAVKRAEQARRNSEALARQSAGALATVIVIVAALGAAVGFVAATLILQCLR